MSSKYPTIYSRKDSPYWQISWFTETGRIRYSTGYLISQHSQDEVLRIYCRKHDVEQPELKQAGLTLEQMRDDILTRIEYEGLRDSTIKDYRISLNHLVNIFGEQYPVKEIKKADVSKIQRHLIERGDRPPTINKICRDLRAVFERLFDDEIIDRNPFRKFKELRSLENIKRHLTVEDVRKLLIVVDNAKSEPIKRLVYIYLYTGLRRGEVLLIERRDIDLDNNRVKVTNIKHRDKRKRWIEIHPQIKEHFEWFLNQNQSDYPFKVVSPDFITKTFKLWIRKASLPDNLHLHSLRHTFVTLALEHGESPWKLKDILDHSSITVTEGYAHTEPAGTVDLGIDFNAQNGQDRDLRDQ